MVVGDVTSYGSNAATVTIEPPLRSNLANNEAVTYDGVQFTVRLSNDVQQFKTSVTDQYTFELDFIEAL